MRVLTAFRLTEPSFHCWIRAWLTSLVCIASSAQIAVAASPIVNFHWHETETTNCRIYKWQTGANDGDVGPRCEAVLARLSKYWFGEREQFRQKCEIVLHSTDDSYFRAVGAYASRTAASVLVGNDKQSPFYRVDVRTSWSGWDVNSLPNEFTHVLFAHHFPDRGLPIWLNEGTALLADPTAKQARHLRDYRRAATDGTALGLSDLLMLADYPKQRDWPAFYGQSLSLVKCLVERDSPRAFVEFVDMSLKQNIAFGLREVYGIQSVEHLQRIWSQYDATNCSPHIPVKLTFLGEQLLRTTNQGSLRAQAELRCIKPADFSAILARHSLL